MCFSCSTVTGSMEVLDDNTVGMGALVNSMVDSMGLILDSRSNRHSEHRWPPCS